MKNKQLLLLIAISVLLTACGSQPTRPISRDEPISLPTKPTPQKPSTGQTAPKRGGGYYLDDGPGDNAPENIAAIPDAQPRNEPLHRFANRPYTVLGKDYVPMTAAKPYKARGIGSWYGRKFHGQKTSSGEVYDMYGMTAAHPTLPIPSYVRVTNVANGKSVVVRVNDRGPFHSDRLIDLSYTGAYKLGYVVNGSTMVEVEVVRPGETLLATSSTSVAPGFPKRDPSTELATEVSSPPKSVTMSTEPAPPVPTVTEPRGTFLQLGSFSSQDNAESLRTRVYQQLTWLNDTIYVQAKGGAYKVQLGPYRNVEEAGRMAERIREALDFKPFVVQR